MRIGKSLNNQCLICHRLEKSLAVSLWASSKKCNPGSPSHSAENLVNFISCCVYLHFQNDYSFCCFLDLVRPGSLGFSPSWIPNNKTLQALLREEKPTGIVLRLMHNSRFV